MSSARGLSALLLLLMTASPVGAQGSASGIGLASPLGGLRIYTGILTAPSGHYRRTSLPVAFGLSWERIDWGGRRWILDLDYSQWDETVPYRDFVQSVIEPYYTYGEEASYQSLTRIRLQTAALLVGLSIPFGTDDSTLIQLGGKLGWRWYWERRKYAYAVPQLVLPGEGTWPSKIDREQLTLEVLVSIPLSTEAGGRELVLGYRVGLADMARKGSEPLTSADGLRIALGLPLGSGRAGSEPSTSGSGPGTGRMKTPYQLGIVYGWPGLHLEPEALDAREYAGLTMTIPFTESWVFTFEAATFFWEVDVLKNSENPWAAIRPLPDDSVPLEWSRRLFLPEGRVWEMKVGGLSPIISPAGIAVRVGGLLGARRQQEWWDFFYAERDLYGSVQELPPPDPGAEVRAMTEVRLVFPLGSRPQYPQVHLSRTWDLGRLWPDRRRTAVDPDGWRVALMLPLGRF